MFSQKSRVGLHGLASTSFVRIGVFMIMSKVSAHKYRSLILSLFGADQVVVFPEYLTTGQIQFLYGYRYDDETHKSTLM